MRDAPDIQDIQEEVAEAVPLAVSHAAKFLLRTPPNTKFLCQEAAEREGLSLNSWIGRVLSEHAKLSRDGWRSVPLNDPPRTHSRAPVVSQLAEPPVLTVPTEHVRAAEPAYVSARRAPEPVPDPEPEVTPPTMAGLQRAEPEMAEPETALANPVSQEFSFPVSDIPDFS